MNEVTKIPPSPSLELRGASSREAVSSTSNQSTTRSGKLLPAPAEKPVMAVAESAGKARESVEKAVASLNDYVQSVQRDLRFSIDEDLNRTVIKVIDSESGDLIRQIPDEVILELARNLKNDGEFQLVSALG